MKTNRAEVGRGSCRALFREENHVGIIDVFEIHIPLMKSKKKLVNRRGRDVPSGVVEARAKASGPGLVFFFRMLKVASIS